ncbi:uncharacterized protein [Miscanthus floridulus]|uniref:uncharacterized protein n=1 Tax=Miscanthus floridulus TaxID=154761 RepID=UPI00345A013A
MGDPLALKRPKLEKDDNGSTYYPRTTSNGTGATATSVAPPCDDVEEGDDISEEAVVALVAHRERDFKRCKLKLLHYQPLLWLARFRDRKSALSRSKPKLPTPPIQRDPKPSPPPNQRDLKPSPQLPMPEKKAPLPAPQQLARPQLVIPRTSNRSAPRPEPMPGLKKAAGPSLSSLGVLPERSRKEEKKPKRKIEQKEHQNLIPNVKKSSATVLKFQGGNLVSSQHRRKLRCLELCPANDQLVVISALDGLVTLWQVETRGYA